MGAWIEILLQVFHLLPKVVAPAWGRGLKSIHTFFGTISPGRPRMGAWIEIGESVQEFFGILVAPAWGRGLKSHALQGIKSASCVAPAWGRGLKYIH